jgi:hypothetical protein
MHLQINHKPLTTTASRGGGAAASSTASEVMQAWRRQLGQRARTAERLGPRPFAIVGYRTRGLLVDGCVPLKNLTLVALFDELSGDGALTTRLVGVAGSIVAGVLRFGGVELTRFEKDLRLAPAVGGRGARLDAADGELLSFALQLERYLERCARHPYVPRRRVPNLPVLPDGDAPLDDSCLVELAALLKRQVLAVNSPRGDLRGRFGTTEFDFHQTRFRVGR